jgi:inosose dehydratase
MIHLASAPVSWGIFEFKGVEPRFSSDQVLDEIAATGYVGTELGPYGFLSTDPDRLRAALSERGLRLLSAFVPVALADAATHQAGLAEALKVGTLLADCGAKHLVLADANGTVPELVARAGQRSGSFLTPSQWEVYAAGVRLIGKELREQLDLDVVFHHHCAGYVETPEETRILLDSTDVDLCLDTGHWHYAGGDAVECLREFGSRVSYCHLKDYQPEVGERCRAEQLDYFRAVKQGLFCPLGQGNVDFPALVAELERQQYDGWAVVEQDVFFDAAVIHGVNLAFRHSRANREYLATLGL